MKWPIQHSVVVSSPNHDSHELLSLSPFGGLRVTLLFLLFVSIVLSGCSEGSAQPATSNSPHAIETQPTLPTLPERQLTDDVYVQLTADVVCLSKTFPTATEDELNVKAVELFKTYRVSETAYDAYQTEIENDPTRSQMISYQIVGQMQDVCGE